MKIPKKVKVGGTHYKIKFVNEVSIGPEYCGSCDSSKLLIEVMNSYKKPAKEQIFLHELLHAIFNHCDLEHDEHLIEILSQALYMVIKDNPEVFK